MIDFFMRRPGYSIDCLGALPTFFWNGDSRPASEQLDERYSHGGGFSTFGEGMFTLTEWEHGPAKLKYPGDPAYEEIARGYLHLYQPSEELILVFDYAIVAIVQKDGTFLVTRCD